MKEKMMKFIAMAVWLLLASPAMAGEVHIAVAANFTDAASRINELFEQRTGHHVKASFGSTGKLYAQIAHGAPFDLFLAADSARPLRAEQDGLAVAGSRFTYAQGRIVLWSPQPDQWKDGASWLTSASFERLAIANPDTAPYGHAAMQVIEHLGLMHALQAKLVYGESIAQTFQFIVSGNASAGFVAASQAQAWQQPGSVWQIPPTLYDPLEQQAVLLKHGKNNPAAWAFLDFLRSDEVRTLIAACGYGVPSQHSTP